MPTDWINPLPTWLNYVEPEYVPSTEWMQQNWLDQQRQTNNPNYYSSEDIPNYQPETSPFEPTEKAKDLKAIAEDSYNYLSDRIQQKLPSYIKYNPSATNWFFDLVNDDVIRGPVITGLTNIPNTLIAGGHGRRSFLGAGGGLAPDSNITNSLNRLIEARMAVVDNNLSDLIAHLKKIDGGVGGGVSMAEIAKGIGGQTNDVKRVILMSCYNAGYKPEDIKKYFPNVEQIIGSEINKKITADYFLYDLFRKKPMERPISGPLSLLNAYSPLYNYTPQSTNEIRQASDWIKPIPRWLGLNYNEADNSLVPIDWLTKRQQYYEQGRLK